MNTTDADVSSAQFEYFYRAVDCLATTLPECGCWYAEGTGPLPYARRPMDIWACALDAPLYWRNSLTKVWL